MKSADRAQAGRIVESRPADYDFIFSAGVVPMTPLDLAELRRRAMAAATLYGCDAYLHESEFPLESPRGEVGLRIIVVRQSRRGDRQVKNVRLPDQNLGDVVARIVSDTAGELPDRSKLRG